MVFPVIVIVIVTTVNIFIGHRPSLDKAITVAQNRPLWRLMSAFGATHP